MSVIATSIARPISDAHRDGPDMWPIKRHKRCPMISFTRAVTSQVCQPDPAQAGFQCASVDDKGVLTVQLGQRRIVITKTAVPNGPAQASNDGRYVAWTI